MMGIDIKGTNLVGLSHFVVIFKITKKHITIGDSAKDLMKVEIEE